MGNECVACQEPANRHRRQYQHYAGVNEYNEEVKAGRA